MVTDSSPTVDQLCERLGNAEKRLRWSVLLSALSLSAFLAIAILGAAPPQTRAAAGGDMRFQTVTARRFLLEDDQGVVRGSFQIDNPVSGPELRLQTPEGYQIYLTAGSSHANFVLMRGGPLSPQNTKQGVQLFATETGPGLRVFDTRGYSAVLGSVALESAETGASSTSSAASLHLFNKAGTVLWSAPR